MPKAKQSWAHSELNISIPALVRLPVKHMGLSWMTTIFQKCFFFSSPHYKNTTLCLHNKAKAAVHSWAGALTLWSLSQRLKMPGMCSGKRKKPAQRQKESKPVCLIKEGHWEAPKAAAFPFPAPKGKYNCGSQGFEKEDSPSPGRQRGTVMLRAASKPHRAPLCSRAEAFLAPTFFSKAELRSRGELTKPICHSSFCFVTPRHSWASTKGTLHTARCKKPSRDTAGRLQRTHKLGLN